jgi:hypothetical protein
VGVTRVPNNKVYRFVMAVAAGNDDIEKLEAGLRRLVVPTPA